MMIAAMQRLRRLVRKTSHRVCEGYSAATDNGTLTCSLTGHSCGASAGMCRSKQSRLKSQPPASIISPSSRPTITPWATLACWCIITALRASVRRPRLSESAARSKSGWVKGRWKTGGRARDCDPERGRVAAVSNGLGRARAVSSACAFGDAQFNAGEIQGRTRRASPSILPAVESSHVP